MTTKRRMKTLQRAKAMAARAAAATQELMRYGTMRVMNRHADNTVAQKRQELISSMTNWQRHQWNKHCLSMPTHRNELAIAQAFAGFCRKTREFKVGELVVAHG